MRKYMSLILVLLLVVTAFGLTACGEKVTEDKPVETKSVGELSGTIIIKGSSTVYPINTGLADAFMKLHPKVKITVEDVGSSGGLKNLSEGKCDIAASSRPVKPGEKEKIGEGINIHTVAYDAITVVVHPDNTVDNLSVYNLGKIFSGEITNWSEVGGNDLPIDLYGREADSGTREVFEEIILPDGDTPSYTEEFDSHEKLVSAVSSNPKGLGFSNISVAEAGNVNILRLINKQRTIAVPPDNLSIKNGDYPIARTLYWITDDTTTSLLTTEFIKFLHSDEGSIIVRENGFVSAF